MGTPSGGPRDEDPPRFVRANPMPEAVNVSRSNMSIDFNELVNVKDAFSKVVVSPPSTQAPRISSSGRRVNIEFRDTLLPNTTYTVDFSNAIQDVNENNPLEGFSYTFSTGPTLDSLRISGMVLNAADLEPQKDVLVGVHSILNDTAFLKLPFERVAKTDDRGRFIIRGLKPGPYRVFALGDANNDFRWDNPEESIAFYNEIVVPQTEQTTVTDTIYNLKTMEVDTVVDRSRTIFLPNDLLLSYFNINFKPQYIVKNERLDSTRISLILNGPSPKIPTLTPLNVTASDDWYDLERSANNDTLTYWLREPSLVSTDTLKMRVDFQGLLRSGEIEERSDTLDFITTRPRAVKPKKKSKQEETDSLPQVRFLDLRMISAPQLDVYSPVIIEVNEPLETFFSSALHLEEKVDSLWGTVPGFNGAEPLDSLSLRRYKINMPWKYGTEYRLRVDSLATHSIYGISNRPAEFNFKVKALADYSSLKMNITGLPDSVPAFMELLTSSDAVARTAPVINGVATFKDVNPGTYYARITLDANGNGKFDTGNYDKQIQPETVFYYPKKINLRKNWDIDQSWNVYELPADQQKPNAIKKNKPERKKHDRQEQQVEEEEDEIFDPTRNPFNPNDRRRSSRNRTTY
ncbi:MAG: Ig-like domain-containing protein [Muribaculaceae bacterium]|nr:Ig-like domain-containing protein [Muribaculaceae bacterium]